MTNGPTDPHDGRTIALPLTLSVRKQLWSAWTVSFFVACLTVVVFNMDARNPNIAISRMVCIVLGGVLAFLLLRLSSAGRASWRFELTDRDLVLPPPYP